MKRYPITITFSRIEEQEYDDTYVEETVISDHWYMIQSDEWKEPDANLTCTDDHDQSIVDYCKDLVNTSFYGQKDLADSIDAPNATFNLGIGLKSLHDILQDNIFDDSSDDASKNQKVLSLLKVIAEKRKRDYETTESCYGRLLQQYQLFLPLYKTGRQEQREVVVTYWGTRQQFLAGKVIADNVLPNLALDPIYGILLCPSAGVRERQDVKKQQTDSYGLDQNFWFDFDCVPKTYHAILYDAFTYLKEFHNIGPGECYLSQHSLFHPNPIPVQTSLLFWKRMFDRINEGDIVLNMKML